MIKAITTLERKTRSDESDVIQEMFSTQHQFWEVVGVIYGDGPLMQFYLSDYGNYGEIHIHWDDENLFAEWCKNPEIQYLRQTFEADFNNTLRDKMIVKRYVDKLIPIFNDDGLPLESFDRNGRIITEIFI